MKDLESIIVDLAYSDWFLRVSERTKHEAKLTILDTLGVCARGNQTKYIQKAAAVLAPKSNTEGSALFALGGRRTTASSAAFINASGAATLELDETLRHGGGHSAVQVLPAAIAVGERAGSDGKKVLRAFLASYELGARLGRTLSPFRKILHPHGIWAACASALASSMILDLSKRQAVEALRISCNLSITTSFNTAFQGATIRDFYVGFASQNGIAASLLAEQGVTGARNAILEVLHPLISDSGINGDPQKFFADFGKVFYIESNQLKVYAACFSLQAPIEAALKFTKVSDVQNIEKINVYTTALASRLARKDPQNALAAKFSIPYAVASTILAGDSIMESFDDDHVQQRAVQNLSKKVSVFADDELTKKAPGKWGSRIEVFLKKGSSGSKNIAGVEDTITMRSNKSKDKLETQILKKFRALVSPIYPKKQERDIEEKILNFERIRRVRDLTDLLL